MTLKPPFMISSRLMAAIKICGCTISIDVLSYAGSRVVYEVWFDFDDGTSFCDQTLKSGCQGGGLQDGMESLLCFLSAAADSYRSKGFDGESANLFDPPIVEWAYQFSDEIELLRMELEENKELITE